MQVRSQKFFREGKVSWIQGTLINISSNAQEKSLQKTLSIFSPRLSENYTLN